MANENEGSTGAVVLPFKAKENDLDADAVRMLRVADEIDSVILKYLGKEWDARDLAGLLAHRLGTLMRNIESKDRKVLWLIVKKVLQEQADLDKAEDL